MAIHNRKKSVKAVVTGAKVLSEEYIVRKDRNAVSLFERKHGIKAQTLNGRKILGNCRQTGRVILERDHYSVNESGELALVMETA